MTLLKGVKESAFSAVWIILPILLKTKPVEKGHHAKAQIVKSFTFACVKNFLGVL